MKMDLSKNFRRSSLKISCLKGASIFLLGMQVGCSSAPIVVTQTETNKASVQPFVQGYDVRVLSKAPTAACREAISKADRLTWKELVTGSGSCASAALWSETHQLAQKLSEKNIETPWGAYFHSLASEGEGFDQKALWMIELALKKAPELGLAHYQKGRLLWKMGESKESIKSFVIAREKDSRLTESKLFLGQIYFRDQEYEAAAKHFTDYLRSKPSNAVALMGVAESKFQLNDAKGALEYFQKTAELYPRRVEALVRIGQIFESKMQDQKSALSYYRQASDLKKSGRAEGTIALNLDDKIQFIERSLNPSRKIAEQGKKEGGKK